MTKQIKTESKIGYCIGNVTYYCQKEARSAIAQEKIEQGLQNLTDRMERFNRLAYQKNFFNIND